jgi:hypothetical protein
MNIRDNLLSRFKWDPEAVRWAAPLRIAMVRALDVHDSIRSKHDELTRDPNLSGLGRKDRMVKWLGETAAPKIFQSRTHVATATARIASRRAKLETPPAIDKTDMAAAFVREAYRSRFAAMKVGDKAHWLLSKQLDPVMYQALSEMPPAMLGIDPTFHKQMVNNWIQLTNPGALAQIEDMDEAVTLARAAYDMSRMIGAQAGDFPNDIAFSTLVDASVGAKAAHLAAEAEKFVDSI